MKYFKVKAYDIEKYICACDIEEAARISANMLQCDISDFEWDANYEKHWFNNDIDIVEVDISLDELVKYYCDIDIVQELLDKKSKEEFSPLEIQKSHSKDPKEFEKGARWVIEELFKRVEVNKEYNWGAIKRIISDMGFKYE